MRYLLSVLMLTASVPLLSQDDCDLFNLQELAESYLATQVDSIVLHLSNGRSQTIAFSNGLNIKFGCTNPNALVYDPDAIVDDGSCVLIVEGCTDPAYTEYDASANTDDGSCSTLATCASPSMDGHTYGVVEIGDQCWFAENLRTTVYADGTPIPEVTDNTAWEGLSTGARCDYYNDASNVATYGRMYNWYAATDAAELCPTGWHVPTDEEWTALETYLGANGHNGAEGAALKSTSGWNNSGNGTDDFGFSALPGGGRSSNGIFYNAGSDGIWWSSSPSGGGAWYRNLYFANPDILRYDDNPRFGFSVRCLRDAD